MAALVRLAKKSCVYALTSLIKVYRLCLSPILPCSCRYYPSCSSYAIDALKKHGVLKGCWLAGKRILSCNPYCDGGYDPVPESFHFLKNK